MSSRLEGCFPIKCGGEGEELVRGISGYLGACGVEDVECLWTAVSILNLIREYEMKGMAGFNQELEALKSSRV